jgi:hypothetical protein
LRTAFLSPSFDSNFEVFRRNTFRVDLRAVRLILERFDTIVSNRGNERGKVPTEDSYYESLERELADVQEAVGGAFEDWYHGLGPAGKRLPNNVARYMREGLPPVPMLLEDWLVKEDLHWIYAEAEAGKTWLGLILALEVMRQGGAVAWFDEELGEAEITRRLLALGAEPDVIAEKFAYFSYPAWSTSDVLAHEETLKHVPDLALVVYDTVTDMLTNAGLNEDKGGDVTWWVKAFPERARQLGVTVIALDHTPKSGDTAVGSRAKRAKSKVMYHMKMTKRFDQESLGKITVKLTKNSRGAPLPQETRTFECGGDQGNFIWRPTGLVGQLEDAAEGKQPLIQRIIEALGAAGDAGLNKSEIVTRTGGNNQAVRKQVDELAGGELYPFEVFKRDGKGHDRFRLVKAES